MAMFYVFGMDNNIFTLKYEKQSQIQGKKMLINLKVKNFKSIKDEVKLSFEAVDDSLNI